MKILILDDDGTLDNKRLIDLLKEAKPVSEPRYRERFLLPYRDGFKPLQVSEINHIEVENKNVFLRLNSGSTFQVSVTLDELEQQLDPAMFFRANRQFIISINQVLFVGNIFAGKLIVHMKGYPKTEIMVSKEKASKLKDWLNR